MQRTKIIVTVCALLAAPAHANDVKSGLVLCSGPFASEKMKKIVGSRLAYEDFRAIYRQYGAPRHLALPSAEWGVLLKSDIVDGIILYDRDIDLASEFQVGVSGTALIERFGDAVKSCTFVMEMQTCKNSKFERGTVSCSDDRALDESDDQGTNF